MPWKDVRPMDQRLLFIADFLRQTWSVAELCRCYGISRKTGYKWIERYQHGGMTGLEEQSRRPAECPSQIPYKIRQAIIECRTQYKTVPGAKKIQVLLARRFPNETLPCKSSIYNILQQAGLIQPRRRSQKVARYPQPFAPVQQVNELWSTDFKGQFKLGNGQWCYPLTVMDHQSRYLVACDALPSTATPAAQKVFERLFKTYGLPQRIRSDNGVPFATRASGGLSRLAVWWIRLGILPERIEPGKPQQNGRHERMHRTLKQAATRPPAASLRGQQRRLNAFCEEYNEQRPHEALGQETPASHYTVSPREFPQRLPEMHYPDYYEVKRVTNNGVIYWRNRLVYVSHLLEDECIGMEEVADGQWDIYFGPVKLGSFDERNKKEGARDYLTIKV